MTSPAALDALLPQTQCGECGFAGCMPYAEALAAGNTRIDRCPPGGVATLLALANALQLDPNPYLADNQLTQKKPALAHIREAECIGCTKCIQACPVDAIIGSAKHMHSVLAHECTGCGLCVEPCPVDCIEILTVPAPQYERETARARFIHKKIRTQQADEEQIRRYRENQRLADKKAKQHYILSAIQRANSKKLPQSTP